MMKSGIRSCPQQEVTEQSTVSTQPPAKLDGVGLSITPRSEQTDQRRATIRRFAIIAQDQIIQPRAAQIDTAPDP